MFSGDEWRLLRNRWERLRHCRQVFRRDLSLRQVDIRDKEFEVRLLDDRVFIERRKIRRPNCRTRREVIGGPPFGFIR
jgi:hypothetical protein